MKGAKNAFVNKFIIGESGKLNMRNEFEDTRTEVGPESQR